MRHRTIWKILVLTLLGVTSYSVSSLLVKGRQTPQADDSIKTSIRAIDDLSELGPVDGPVGRGEVRTSGVNRIRIANMGSDQFFVYADGHIRDQRPGRTFVWRFQVLELGDEPGDEPGDVLWDHWYTDETVPLVPGQRTELPFRDFVWLPFPPAVYVGKLSQYSVPPNLSVADLMTNPDLADRYETGGASAPMRVEF